MPTLLHSLPLAILFSCTPSQVKNQLLDVESYIMERPDSALAVLESMDRSLLVTEADRARHALLNAMALDKNFIDVSDDSLARLAVDYYSKRGDRKYYARALFYLGYVGGSNSMRGWTPRTLGPGNTPEQNTPYPVQMGDMRLEANLEFRFPIWGMFNGATFLDLGNVWYLGGKRAQVPEDGVFHLDRFSPKLKSTMLI